MHILIGIIDFHLMDRNWDIDWRMMKDMTLLPLFGPRGSAGSTSVRKNEVPEPQGDCSCFFFATWKKNLSWWTPLVHVDWWEPFLKIHPWFFPRRWCGVLRGDGNQWEVWGCQDVTAQHDGDPAGVGDLVQRTELVWSHLVSPFLHMEGTKNALQASHPQFRNGSYKIPSGYLT